MNKRGIDIKNIEPTLSGKERALLILRNRFSEPPFLAVREEVLLKTIKTDTEGMEFRDIIYLAGKSRFMLREAFIESFHQLKYLASFLSPIYFMIEADGILNPLQDFLATVLWFTDEQGLYGEISKEDIESLLKRLKSLRVLQREDNFAERRELIHLKEEVKKLLLIVVPQISERIEELFTLKEVEKLIAIELKGLPYPGGNFSQFIEEALREARFIQKSHNDKIFNLLRTPYKLKVEIPDFNSYVIKTPKIDQEEVKKALEALSKTSMHSIEKDEGKE